GQEHHRAGRSRKRRARRERHRRPRGQGLQQVARRHRRRSRAGDQGRDHRGEAEGAMTRRHYGALYLVTPGQPDVLETYDDARSHIDVAKELWSLAEDDARAGAIANVVDRAYERESRTLVAADIDELLALLDGLEDALARTITDEHLN